METGGANWLICRRRRRRAAKYRAAATKTIPVKTEEVAIPKRLRKSNAYNKGITPLGARADGTLCPTLFHARAECPAGKRSSADAGKGAE